MSKVKHPGVILAEKVKEQGISQTQFAIALGIAQSRVNKILMGERGISPDTAIRLGKYFGTEAQYWLGLQADYEIAELAKSGKKAEIENMVRVLRGQ